MPREIKFNSGYNDCNDMIAILKNESVPRDLTNLEELNKETISNKDLVYVDSNGSGKQISLKDILDQKGLNSDWNAPEGTSSYIKNKPDLSGCNLQKDVVSLYNIGGIQVGESFDINTPVSSLIEKMLTYNFKQDDIKVGKINKLPSLLNDEEIESLPDHALTVDEYLNGLVIDKQYSNDYFVIAIPKLSNLMIDSITQGGWSIDFSVDQKTEYSIYYYNKPSTGHFVLTAKFKNKE